MSAVTSEESVSEDSSSSTSSSVVKACLALLDANTLVEHPMIMYTFDENAANQVCCNECEPEFNDICCKPKERKKRSLRKPYAKPPLTCKPKSKPKPKPACKRKVKPKKTCPKRKPKASPKER